MSSCAATMCPYLGVNDGSPWTGERKGECESSCGWWHDGACVAASDLSVELFRDFEGELPEEWPACQYEEECQWQQQCGDVPCPPRAAIMTGQSELLDIYSGMGEE